MRNKGYFIKQYWNYYLELERQVLDTRKYVEFSTQNYNTYSIEYMKLLQAICSEIDVFGKVLAQLHNSEFKITKTTNIKQWGYEVQQDFDKIEKKSIIFDEMFDITPFKKWSYEKRKNRIVLKDNSETPFWWLAYNSVKHGRTSIDDNNELNYQKANLKNVIYSLGALFLMEKYAMKKYYGIIQDGDSEFVPRKSKLFIVRL